MNPAVSFPRLTFVELRKMVDTRAGFWLQLTTAVFTLAIVILFCIFGETDELDLPRHVRARDPAREHPAADHRHPARLFRVVAAHGADHVHARPQADARDEREDRRRGRAGGDRARDRASSSASLAIAIVGGAWTMGLAVFLQICVLLVTGDAQRRRVRRGVPELRAGGRPVLRAADRVRRARRDPDLQRRRRLDRHHADDQPADRGRGLPASSGPGSGSRWACGWSCRWRSASTASPRARSAPPRLP